MKHAGIHIVMLVTAKDFCFVLQNSKFFVIIHACTNILKSFCVHATPRGANAYEAFKSTGFNNMEVMNAACQRSSAGSNHVSSLCNLIGYDTFMMLRVIRRVTSIIVSRDLF